MSKSKAECDDDDIIAPAFMSENRLQLPNPASVQAEIDALRAENERLRDDAVEEMKKQTKLLRMQYEMIGGGEAVFASPFVGILAEWIAEDFLKAGGINFTIQEFEFRKHGQPYSFRVTVQKTPDGKSPAKIIDELKRGLSALLAKLTYECKVKAIRKDTQRAMTAARALLDSLPPLHANERK